MKRRVVLSVSRPPHPIGAQIRSKPMTRILPRDVRKALELLEADPAPDLSVPGLASACGVAPRTLQKHFRRFLGRTPHEVRTELRLGRARRALLAAAPDASVTAIALRCGFRHLGRFAGLYARRYGESPSATLRARSRIAAAAWPSAHGLRSAAERPSVAVVPFTFAGLPASHSVIFAEEIAAALGKKSAIGLGPPPTARYHLRGTIQSDGSGRQRAILTLIDRRSGRRLWADRWDGGRDEALAFQDRVSDAVAAVIERVVRNAEIDDARRNRIEDLGAWQLTMRAWPDALTIEAAAQSRAVELLERAMERAPEDALPAAFAAWCHGQRAAHAFTASAGAEKRAARELARRASQLDHGDPLVQALIGAAYTLAHELVPAKHHLDRALALDAACVWAWNRSGWVSLYEGKAAEAIERFRIARTIAPDDALAFYCTIGIAAAHFEAGRYEEAARWYTRGLAEHPAATWVNRFRAPAYALAGRRDEARQGVAELSRAYPALTIAEITSALPNTPRFLARQAAGLEAAGLHP
jgi:AraC-like DNA-binding protein/tetratricopeptide (TPR) repeat protein